MEKTRRKIIASVFPILLGLNTFALEPNWVLFDSSTGIKSYRLPGSNGQPDSYKAEAVFNCRVDVIAVILKDFENYPAWMPGCIKLEQIESIDANNLILYYQHHTPWPVYNRDAVLHISTNLDTNRKALFITSQSINDNRLPPTKYLVRMKKMVARWQIQYIDEGHSEIVYEVFSDPGGLIPVSQVNLFSRNLPFKTLIGLEKMSKSPRYIEMAKRSTEKTIIDNFSQKD